MTTTNDVELNEPIQRLATYVIDQLPTREHVDRRFVGMDRRFKQMDESIAEVKAMLTEILNCLPPAQRRSLMVRRPKERGRPMERAYPPRIDATAEHIAHRVLNASRPKRGVREQDYGCADCGRPIAYPETLGDVGLRYPELCEIKT